jgi:hypothetical protein
VATNAVNAPAAPQATPQAAGPALPSLSPEACSVLATYIKTELKGDIGLPVTMRIAPDKHKPKPGAFDAKTMGDVKPGEFKDLETGLAQSVAQGSQIDCDWKSLGMQPPQPQTGESNAWIRFRPIVAGDVALLDVFTDGVTQLHSRCFYRKKAGAWVRGACGLTPID